MRGLSRFHNKNKIWERKFGYCCCMKNENNRAIRKILDKICPRAVSKPVLEGVRVISEL